MDLHIDSDIGRWVLEFLLRQPLENRLLNSLINVLPLPDDNPSLKRTLLVRRIESEISKGCVSESILDFLEQIEELDFQNGIEGHSGSIKAAYCAVAVACTVKFLAQDGEASKFNFFEAVKRIWRGKVCKMEKVDNVGLISDELSRWKDDIEAAIWEDSVCDRLLKRNEGMDAVGAVRAYVDEEKGKMDPSFLEFVAQTMRTNDTLRELLCGDGNAEPRQAGGEVENLPSAADQEFRHCDGNTGGHKEIVPFRRKHIAVKRSRVTQSGRGAKISDPENSGADLSCKRCELPPTPEVNKAQEALKSSLLELQTSVEDPLPDALHCAEAILTMVKRKNKSEEPVEESHVRDNPPLAESSRAVHANGEDLNAHCPEVRHNTPEVDKAQEALKSSSFKLRAVLEDPLPDALVLAKTKLSTMTIKNKSKEPVEESHVRDNTSVAGSPGAVHANVEDLNTRRQEVLNNIPVHKPSLMDRNSTAHAFEWDDSIDDSPGASGNRSRLQLPSPKNRLISPLKKYKANKLMIRRKFKRWSTLEEDTLRAAVQKYGSGNWKLILNAYRDVFEERTEVDLKDKWRNIMRYARP